jgi:tetratricopeptide (TPR) repeat protein
MIKKLLKMSKHRKLLRIAVIFGLLISGSIHIWAISPEETISKAGKAYSSGQYSEAAEAYKSVIDGGYESSDLYYNLGNAYFKMQDYPNSILWYERAKKLDPGNENVDFNLNVANTKISDKIDPIPELFYKRWYKNLIFSLSVDTWARLTIISLFLSLAGFILYQISRILFLRKAGFWAGLSLVVISLFFLLFAWSGHYYLTSDDEGIVFSATITAKSSPDDNSTDLFVLHEGTKVVLLDNINGWYEIRIANGSVGWLPHTSLVKI